jgi:hypothetical protein
MPRLVREIARRLAPRWAKAAHQRWLEKRRVRRLEPIAEGYRTRHGSDVRSGPFAGLRYPPDLVQVPKAVGTYELELHEYVEACVARDCSTVVNVGAAEGYYAVGLALRLPAARVHAYDIDEASRERCRRLAELNGVADRVEVRGECTLAELEALPATDVALVLDCEGCELALLRPDRVEPMRGWAILVELHDFIEPGTTKRIVERFEPTHDAVVVEQRDRDDLAPPELEFLGPRDRALALDEFRPGPMRWAWLVPRALRPGP